MKKVISVMLVVLLVFSLTAIVCGCGGKDPDANQKIKDYIEVAKQRSDYEQTIESSRQAGIDLDVIAVDDDLVYKAVYMTKIDESQYELIEQSIESSSAMLEVTAEAIKKEAPYIDEVVYSYYNSNGELIVSVSF